MNEILNRTDIPKEWMLGEIPCGFRRERRTEDNLFMIETLIEMVKGRKVEICVAFLDMEKAYDRVNILTYMSGN